MQGWVAWAAAGVPVPVACAVLALAPPAGPHLADNGKAMRQ
jgi:hypothetical protein